MLLALVLLIPPNTLSPFRSVVAVPVVLLNISVVLEGSVLPAAVSTPLLRPQLAFPWGSFGSPNTDKIQWVIAHLVIAHMLATENVRLEE